MRLFPVVVLVGLLLGSPAAGALHALPAYRVTAQTSGEQAPRKNRDGQTQIYLMNADGSGQIKLTSGNGNDDNPRWSPDGTAILFQSDRDNSDTGYNDIYVMDAGGNRQTRLTTDPNDDSSAAWSPDGRRVVFQSLRGGTFYRALSGLQVPPPRVRRSAKRPPRWPGTHA